MMVSGSSATMEIGLISNLHVNHSKALNLLMMKKEKVMKHKIETENGRSFLSKKERVMVDIG